MNTTENRHSPIRRQLDAYAESWKSDHLAAQECFDVEEGIAIGVSLASVLDQMEAGWRGRVFRGTRPPSDDEADLFRALLELWLIVSDMALSRAVELEGRFETVKGIDDLRAVVARTRSRLDTWTPPTPAKAIGLREQTLSPEEATELDALLQRAAPPSPTRTFDTKDSSFLS